MSGKLVLAFMVSVHASAAWAMPGGICTDFGPRIPGATDTIDRPAGLEKPSRPVALRMPRVLRDGCES